MPTIFVQVQACSEEDGMVAPCSVSDAEFFSVYLGKPGDFDCVADFYELNAAWEYARNLAAKHGATIVDLTLQGTV